MAMSQSYDFSVVRRVVIGRSGMTRQCYSHRRSAIAIVLKWHTYIHTYVRTYVRTYVHTYIHTYIHTYTHTYIHTYIHTSYIHTYIHTYANNGQSQRKGT